MEDISVEGGMAWYAETADDILLKTRILTLLLHCIVYMLIPAKSKHVIFATGSSFVRIRH